MDFNRDDFTSTATPGINPNDSSSYYASNRDSQYQGNYEDAFITSRSSGPDIGVDEKSPEQSRASSSSSGGTLVFPSHLRGARNFITLHFYKVVRKDPLESRKDDSSLTVCLPIPQNLVENFSMQYNDKKLNTGVTGGALALMEDAGALNAGTVNTLARGGSEGVDKSRQLGQNLAREVKSSASLLPLLHYGLNAAGSDSVGKIALERATGTILNPYQALQFDGVNLRKHTFTYKFSPNSPDESVTLYRILMELKARMHPEKQGLLYTFPEMCKIRFAPDNLLPYTFQDCYLENMVVNYAPSNTPAFFKGGRYPAEVEVSMTFGEIRPLTREFFEDTGYDNVGGESAGGGGITQGIPSNSEIINSNETSIMDQIEGDAAEWDDENNGFRNTTVESSDIGDMDDGPGGAIGVPSSNGPEADVPAVKYGIPSTGGVFAY